MESKSLKVSKELLERSLDIKKFKYCLECGTCTASCPVANLIPEQFNPRSLLLKTFLNLGLRDKVLSSETIWFCSGCYTCQERCPSGVDVTDLIVRIRNAAILEKYPPPRRILEQGRELARSGRLVTPTRFANRQRARLGLEEASTEAVEEALQLIRKTGFDRLVGSYG
ncbi:MAG: 4Fe-4S dicluster domain-containing protein [Candidatus Bathyarchaeia archaeon]